MYQDTGITVGKVLLAAAIVLLGVLSFTVLAKGQITKRLGEIAQAQPPAAFAFMEKVAPILTWIGMGLIILSLVGVVIILQKDGMGGLAKTGLIESGESHDVREGLRLGAEVAGLTAFTWVVLSPIPIIPGAVHLRTFAFVPGLIGLVLGRGVGFIAGAGGTLLWTWLAGMFHPVHSTTIDLYFVGLLTGWIIPVIMRGNKSRDELLEHIKDHRISWMLKCAAVNLLAGVIMSVFVAASLKTVVGLPSWWMGFFAIGVISDTLPMVIFTPLFTEPLLRLTKRHTELPNF